jgi:hypothetical protein
MPVVRLAQHLRSALHISRDLLHAETTEKAEQWEERYKGWLKRVIESGWDPYLPEHDPRVNEVVASLCRRGAASGRVRPLIGGVVKTVQRFCQILPYLHEAREEYRRRGNDLGASENTSASYVDSLLREGERLLQSLCREAADVGIDCCGGDPRLPTVTQVVEPGAQPPPAGQESRPTDGPFDNGRTFCADGETYAFTPGQAGVVMALWEAHERGTPDGRRVHLETLRVVNRYVTSEAAVRRFILAQQPGASAGDPNAPDQSARAGPRTPGQRLRTSDRAEAELVARGL